MKKEERETRGERGLKLKWGKVLSREERTYERGEKQKENTSERIGVKIEAGESKN